MDRIKRYGLLIAGVLLLSGVLLVGAFVIPAAAQTGARGTGGSQAPNGPGMMNGSGGMMRGAGGMMGDVDRHFIEMMIPHHQAAVAMADLALQKAQHPQLKGLAAAIRQTQTAEIAQMRAWYRQWYGTDVPANANENGGGMMGGAGMMGGQGGMAGDLSSLQNAADFDKAFIQRMVPHHQMALMMSQMVLAHGQQPDLKNLVQSIITGQSAEIARMRGWYQQWYGVPTP